MRALVPFPAVVLAVLAAALSPVTAQDGAQNGATDVAPGRDQPDFAALRAAIVPCESELQWQKIPWRASLWHAVLEGHATRRPILLWAMNGHPLACT